jgi:hypothetical protein
VEGTSKHALVADVAAASNQFIQFQLFRKTRTYFSSFLECDFDDPLLMKDDLFSLSIKILFWTRTADESVRTKEKAKG